MTTSVSKIKRSIALSVFAVLAASSAVTNAVAHDGNEALAGVVLDRAADKRARDSSRHPVQTLSFFHIAPGMNVAEALPGSGWYSEIIANYLGPDGALYGINYNESMWPMFGFFTPEQIEQMSARTAAFPEMVSELTENGVTTGGFTFETAPEQLFGTLDRVLFIRALHNLSRFETQGGTKSEALKVAFDLLKEDGMVGVVQHRAPVDAEDKWADGSAGYLKQSAVVSAFEQAGFELVAQSEINANEKDKPTTKDTVWRLPPSMNGTADDPDKRAQVEAIGESDRMTLLFKKKGASVSAD
jgi:predicted methyltransferase